MEEIRRLHAFETLRLRRAQEVDAPPPQKEKVQEAEKEKEAKKEKRTNSPADVSHSSQQPVKDVTKQRATTDREKQKKNDKDEEDIEREAEENDSDVVEVIDLPPSSDDDGDDPFKSYNAFLEKRERIFPYAQHPRAYKHRHTLLNEDGRYMEYFRFGFFTRFPAVLYPSAFQRYETQVQAELGCQTERRLWRRMELTTLFRQVPTFYFHTKDKERMKEMTATFRQTHDVPAPSNILGGLPEELQHDPVIADPHHPTTVKDVVKRAISQRRRWRGAQQPSYLADSSAARKKARGQRAVTNASRAMENRLINGSRSESEEEESSSETDRRSSAGVEPPQLQMRAGPVVNEIDSDDGQTNQSTTIRVKKEKNVDVGTPVSVADAQNTQNQVQTTVPASLMFRNAALASEMVAKEKMRQASAMANGECAGPPQDPQASPNLGVLAEIWAEIDPKVRNLILLTQDTGTKTQEALAKKEKETIDRMKKFDGNANNSAEYLNELFRSLGQQPLFTSQHAARIMMNTMVGMAATWVLTAAMTLNVTGRDAFVMMLGKFRQRYLTSNQASMWRRQLTDMRLQISADQYIGTHELEMHSASFTRTLNNLRMCEREVPEEDAIHMYKETLPPFIYSYLGDDVRPSLEETQNAAMKAIRSRPAPSYKGKKTTEHNAAPVVKTTPSGDQRYDNQVQRGARCFHCGNSGHYLSDCAVYRAGKPQLPDGAAAYASRQKQNGTNYPYDPAKIIEFAQKKRSDFGGSRSTGTPRVGGGRRLKKKSQIPDSDSEEDSPVSAPNPPGAARNGPAPQGKTKPTAHNSLEIVDTAEAAEEGDWEGEKDDEQVITLSAMSTRDPVSDDTRIAASMCVSVELNGVPVGHGLVDQGANRSLMRHSAYLRHGLDHSTVINKVSHYSVKTASNHRIPIIGRFMASITSEGREFNEESVIYVVDDVSSKESDISCDLVIGRQTLARSKYRLVDTLHARLVSPVDRNHHIQCQSCEPTKRSDGKHDLQLVVSEIVESESEDKKEEQAVPTMTMEVRAEKRRPSLK